MTKTFLLSVAFTALLLAGCSREEPPRSELTQAEADTQAPSTGSPKAGSEQATIEASIIPAVTIDGEARQTLRERMVTYNAPQVSVAVYRNGALDWTKGYGEGTDAETLFQAASLSKAVAATGIVALASELGVSLDEDISGDLEGVDQSKLNPEGVVITLRMLLSHTNGATVSGFPGYAAGEAVPTNLEVVTGSERTNTDPVTIAANPEGKFSYAGGGYQLAQLWAEQASGEDFTALMERLILNPVGMKQSTFAQPLSADMASGNVAPAYEGNGDPVEGGWHTYPEQAAAGLWTTPEDYGRFVMALIGAMNGESGTGISPEVATEVVRPVSEDYGLGIGVEMSEWTDGGEIVLRHSGSNKGYKTYFEAWPERGDAIVVMTGTDGAYPLNADIVRTAKQAYGWPMGPVRTRARHDVDEDALDQLSGAYIMAADGEQYFTIARDSQDLTLTTRRGAAYRMVPVEENVFIDPNDGEEATFKTDGDTVTVSLSGTVFEQAPEDRQSD